MLQKEKLKKGVFAVGCVTLGLLLLAVIVGVLNATVGDGTWIPGWSSYRYDDTGFEVGEGTVPCATLNAIEVDWIDGEVEIVPCRDTFPSVTELANEELTEKSRVRWKVSEDGKTLTVKYRASSFFLGSGAANKHKKLILRIPESVLAQLDSFSVKSVSADVKIDGITAGTIAVSAVSGEIVLKNGSYSVASLSSVSGKIELADTAAEVLTVSTQSGGVGAVLPEIPEVFNVTTKSGRVYLALPGNPSYRMKYSTSSGKRVSAFTETEADGIFTAGDGACEVNVTTVSGNLTCDQIK